jgi:hypothetical protein
VSFQRTVNFNADPSITPRRWSAAATFEGELSNVTTSYAGKGVVRYSW